MGGVTRGMRFGFHKPGLSPSLPLAKPQKNIPQQQQQDFLHVDKPSLPSCQPFLSCHSASGFSLAFSELEMKNEKRKTKV